MHNGQLKDISFSQSALTLEASPNIKKLKRACIESFLHFDPQVPKTLDLLVALTS